jgi:hypothetical protein
MADARAVWAARRTIERMTDDAPRTWTVDDHLRGADPAHVALWHRVVALVEACGPVTVLAHKTTVSFAGERRGFAGARPTQHGVDGFLDLQRPLGPDRRVRRVTPYTKRLFVHQFRVVSEADLDDEFAGWVREAYAVGAGAHLR